VPCFYSVGLSGVGVVIQDLEDAAPNVITLGHLGGLEPIQSAAHRRARAPVQQRRIFLVSPPGVRDHTWPSALQSSHLRKLPRVLNSRSTVIRLLSEIVIPTLVPVPPSSLPRSPLVAGSIPLFPCLARRVLLQ